MSRLETPPPSPESGIIPYFQGLPLEWPIIFNETTIFHILWGLKSFSYSLVWEAFRRGKTLQVKKNNESNHFSLASGLGFAQWLASSDSPSILMSGTVCWVPSATCSSTTPPPAPAATSPTSSSRPGGGQTSSSRRTTCTPRSVKIN